MSSIEIKEKTKEEIINTLSYKLDEGKYDINISFTKLPDVPKKRTELEEIIKRKKSRICVAINADNIQELLRIIEMVGPHVCIIKIHIDMVHDYVDVQYESIEKLNALKEKHDFLIWEDRKFADSPEIVYKQIDSSAFRLRSWADIVSVHLTMGPEILDACCGIMIVGVIEMEGMNGSIKNFTVKDDDMSMMDHCTENIDVVGILTNTNIYKDVDPTVHRNLLQIVDGIHESTGKTFEHVAGADIIIVDSQVIDSESVIKRYKEDFTVTKKLIHQQDLDIHYPYSDEDDERLCDCICFINAPVSCTNRKFHYASKKAFEEHRNQQ